MIVEVEVQADAERVSIHIPQAEMAVEIPNLVAYDLSTGKILAIGKTENDLEGEAPEGWKAIKSRTGFAAPYDIEHFNSQFAVAILHYYTWTARNELRRGIQKLWPFDFWKCNLRLADYGKLPVGERKEFEHLLRKSLKISSLFINGNPIEKVSWRHTIANCTLGFFSVLWIIILFAVFLLVLRSTGLGARSISSILDLIAFAAVSVVVCYIAVFLGTVSWVFIMRGFLPHILLRNLLPKVGLSQVVIKWLGNTLLDGT